jgi:peptide/nickel transport system permease protein
VYNTLARFSRLGEGNWKLSHIVKRLVLAVPVIWGVVTIVFVLTRALPGDPAETMLSQSGGSPQAVEQLRTQLALDQPLYVQYGRFLWDLAHGDLGRSLFTNRPVTVTLIEQLPSTLTLALAAMILAVVLGTVLGVLAAVFQDTWIDSLCMSVAVLGVSTPVFWSAILLITLFSALLHWLPATGQGSVNHLIMPTLVLGFASSGAIARLIRSSMLEILAQDYITTARAKGLRRRITIIRHAFRNALIPAVTLIGLQFGFLLGGTVVIETVFSRQGIGRLTVDAILWKDFPVVQGAILLSAIVYTLLNITVDVSYAIIDPRLRSER